MAEQLDPILETRLRAVLHDEADAVPFTLRAGELDRLAGQRRRARRTQRLSMLAMAAVVVVAIVSVAAVANLRSSGPVASGKLAALPSYERLVAAGGGAPEVVRAESDAIALDGQWQYGLTQGTSALQVVVACSGGPILVSTAREDTPGHEVASVACSGKPVAVSIPADAALASATSPSVVLNAPGGTAWRMVVLVTTVGPSPAGPPQVTPSHTPPVDATGLATFDALRSSLVNNMGAGVAVALTAEHPIAVAGSTPVSIDAGQVPSAHLVLVALSCLDGSVTVALMDGTTVVGSGTSACTTLGLIMLDGTTRSGAASRLVVTALPSVRWRLEVAAGDSQPSSPIDALPTADQLLAAAPAGAIKVAEGGSYSTDPVTTYLDGIGGLGTVEVVGACIGGPLNLSTAPASGSEVPFGSLTCDGTIHTSRVVVPADATQVLVAAAAGTTWSGIVVDVNPAPSLPPLAPGDTTLVSLDLTAADGTVERTAARPKGTDSYTVDGACSGDGSIDLTIDGVEGSWACATFNTLVFTLGPGTQARIKATVSGTARFLVRLDARDMAADPSVKFIPPTLSLTGPDFTAGDTFTVAGFPGCGMGWDPKGGGGFNVDCGPPWQAIAAPLHQRPGTVVTVSLPAGWTITSLTAAMASNADILPSGGAPAEQPLAVSHSGGTWTLRVPPAGDWGLRLSVSATRNGDSFSSPFYGRVIVQP